MTPMIDVVFLLIIFFLISSHLNRQETQAELKLPVATTGAHPAQLKQARIVINVDKAGALSIGGKFVTTQTFARTLAARLGKVGEKERFRFEVRIRTSKHNEYKVVQSVMNQCVKQGVWNVTFAVYRPEDAK